MNLHPANDDRLSAFLDGDLSEADAAAFESALAADPALRAELESIRRVRDALRSRGPALAPPGFADRVLARVESEPLPANSGFPAWLRRPLGVPLEGLAVAATALLVVLAGMGVGVGGMVGGFSSSDVQMSPAASPAEQKAAPKDTGTVVNGLVTPAAPRKGEAKKTAKPPPAPVASPAPPAPPATVLPPSKGEKPTTFGAEVQSAEMLASWSYLIARWDSDVLGRLSRLAAQHGGKVVDAQGRPVGSGDIQEGGQFYVSIPADRVVAFDDALRSLGASPAGVVDPKSASGNLRIRVDIQSFSKP